jgi:hypothetical protein
LRRPPGAWLFAETLRRRVEDGALAVIRDGRLIRVHPDDLARYIQQRRYG